MFWSMMLLGCPKVDQQAWRMDDKEQMVLRGNAEEFWQGLRWGELTRSAQYIEDPLQRSRFMANYQYGEYIDIKVLHAELQPQTDEQGFEQEIWREGTVFVQVESIVDGHAVQKREEEQLWVRKADGWFVVLEGSSLE